MHVMVSGRHREWITVAVRVVLAAVLGYAGYAKIRQPPGLRDVAVSAYRIVPKGLVPAVGVGLPLLEMTLAVMILLGLATRVMAVCVGLLFVVFIAGVVSAWTRGLSIDCGCFGGGGAVGRGQTHYFEEVLRDAGLLVLAAWLVAFPRGRLALDRALGLYAA